jgi:hypothetical protein
MSVSDLDYLGRLISPSWAAMPIRRFLDGQAFEPEMISSMSDVLEHICAELV